MDESAYVEEITKAETFFDIIVIDGNHRFSCAKKAIQKLSEGGMIVLDNSDWYPKTSEFLRNQDLIEIDFHGLAPINNYTWTTSIFLKRNYSFSPLTDRQPMTPIGGLPHLND